MNEALMLTGYEDDIDSVAFDEDPSLDPAILEPTPEDPNYLPFVPESVQLLLDHAPKYDPARNRELEEEIRNYSRDRRVNRNSREQFTESENELMLRNVQLAASFTFNSFKETTDNLTGETIPPLDVPYGFDDRFAFALEGIRETILSLSRKGNNLHNGTIQFSTFAYSQMRREMTRSQPLHSTGRAMSHLESTKSRSAVNKMTDEFIQLKGYEPTIEALAADDTKGERWENMHLEELEELFVEAQRDRIDHLNTDVEHDIEDGVIIDQKDPEDDITDEYAIERDFPGLNEYVDAKSKQQALESLFPYLSERERTVVQARFIEGKTLGAVGDELGVTRERVRQLETKLLAKMRHTNQKPNTAKEARQTMYSDSRIFYEH